MILGFAHITENRADATGDWIPNPPEKWPLMAYPANWHRIGLPHPRAEVVAYDTGVVSGRVRLADDKMADCIRIAARDPFAEINFLRAGLGFEQNPEKDLRISLPSQILSWGVAIRVTWDASAPIDPPLDIDGYAALAFYSTNVEADRGHLLKCGGRDATKPFTVKLDREMKIVMLRSPEGTIIELIQVMGMRRSGVRYLGEGPQLDAEFKKAVEDSRGRS